MGEGAGRPRPAGRIRPIGPTLSVPERRGNALLRLTLDAFYERYNRPEFIPPDPVEFPRRYRDVRDREIVALVAALLAYGRVVQIHRSAAAAVERMESPAEFLADTPPEALRKTFRSYRHRFASGRDMACLLLGMRRVVERHGSLEACFRAGLGEEDTVVPALSVLAEEIVAGSEGDCGHLLPRPRRGGACKRLHLFLRWMVRKDDVDPGGWEGMPLDKLVVPLDTHMHRIGKRLGFTARSTADLRTALEITEGFRRVRPEDPVRYDFALTRPAILGHAVHGIAPGERRAR